MSLALTQKDVEVLTAKSEELIKSREMVTNYRDAYPAIEAIIKSAGKNGISEGVQFLISEGALKEEQRGAAIRGFRREKSRREKENNE